MARVKYSPKAAAFQCCQKNEPIWRFNFRSLLSNRNFAFSSAAPRRSIFRERNVELRGQKESGNFFLADRKSSAARQSREVTASIRSFDFGVFSDLLRKTKEEAAFEAGCLRGFFRKRRFFLALPCNFSTGILQNSFFPQSLPSESSDTAQSEATSSSCALSLRYGIDMSMFRKEDQTNDFKQIRDKQLLALEFSRVLSKATLVQIMNEIAQQKTIDLNLWHFMAGHFDRQDKQVNVDDCFVLLKACLLKQFRDFDAMQNISAVLLSIIHSSSFSSLFDICDVYSELGVLYDLLFFKIEAKLRKDIDNGASISSQDFVRVLKYFALQRCAKSEFYEFLITTWKTEKFNFDAPSAAHVLFWLSFACRINNKLLNDLEKCILPSLESLKIEEISLLVHAYFLAEKDEERMSEIITALNILADLIISKDAAFWNSEDKLVNRLHRRLLLIRSCMRYLHRDTYVSLPTSTKSALRFIHQIEKKRKITKKVQFVEKMSWFLTKLRIAYSCYVTRGPFVFDIVERDRKIIWFCNSYHRFYVGTTDMIASEKLKQRVAKAMSYKIVNCQFWQWGKMKAKRSRFEYVRMSRYYALRDRREFDDEFENWSLPHIHWLHKKSKSIHFDNFFPNYKPLSDTSY